MLLIDPIAWYLLAEHGPGYSVWFLEAGHTVLPKRLAMIGLSGGRPHGTICRHIISKLKCGATLFCGIFFFCLVCGRFYTLSRKKNVMFGALGRISDKNFYMCMQKVPSLEKCLSQIFDTHLRIKVMALWSFPIGLYVEAMHLQCFPPTLRECALFRKRVLLDHVRVLAK